LLEILTVCTGNICRSPLAEELLRLRLTGLPVRVRSAGTYWLENEPMTAEAIRLAAGFGIPAEESAAHRSHALTEGDLVSPDLILTMTRDHRRDVVELAPARVRSTFTVREFARLASAVSGDELRDAAEAAGPDAAARGRAAIHVVSSHRGWKAYQRSAAEMEPAIDDVVRVLRAAMEATPVGP